MVDEKSDRIHPQRLVERGASLEGRVDTATMTRLADAVVSMGALAEYELRFERNAADRPSVRGRVAAEVTVTCQRCMGDMPLGLEGEVLVELVSDAEEEAREEGYETWAVSGGVDLAEVVETELLLCLPFAPVHETGCEVDEQYVPKPEEARRESPFAGLRDLMDN